MKNKTYIIIISVLLIFNSCITQFIPETKEIQELIVVEGLVTDQPTANVIKLSRSLPMGKRSVAIPLHGCVVRISDEKKVFYLLSEMQPGTYVTNPGNFRGVIGEKYKLHIKTDKFSYESLPMELKPVPPIDTLFYRKIEIKPKDAFSNVTDACQIYLESHDPSNNCRFYRWDYTETWEFRLPFGVPVNRVCWISNNSNEINIKNTSALSEDVVDKYPLKFITGETDRLRVKYSMLVNQYSINEDEFLYWEKLKTITQDVGSLYDITPAAIPNNIYCIEDPSEAVLGYFSVSSKTSRRIFIKDYYRGIVDLYTECINDTIFSPTLAIPGLNTTRWILNYGNDPDTYIITTTKGCADCTTRGTIVEPDFWRGEN